MALPPQSGPKTSPRPFYIHVYQETHPFYTCGDLVRGTIRVEPTLRPQRITIVFRGWCVIFNHEAGGASPSFFKYKQVLFESSGAHGNFDILRRGTARDGKVDLPFEFTFPQSAWMAPPPEREWRYSKDSYNHPRFQHSPGFPLPPSYTGPASLRGPFPVKINYSLEACLESALVDNGKITARHELKFLPPAPEHDLSLLEPNLERAVSLPKHSSRYKLIRTRKLLPRYDNSTLGKVKDLLVEKEVLLGLHSLDEIPFAKFSLFATPARIMVIGSPLLITMSVKHLERSASILNPPDVFMRRIRVQLMPVYSILIPRPSVNAHITKETVETSRETWTLLDRKFDEGPGQCLIDGLRLSDIGAPVLQHSKLLPSFSSYGVNLEYEMQVEIWGECASHEFSGLACRTEVQIVSGWDAAPPPAHVDETDGVLPTMPAYQERDPMLASSESPVHAELGLAPENRVPAYASLTPSPPIPLGATTSRELPPPYMG